MTIAFTICSVNYLAQARTLGDSLRQTNPAYQYIIGLVDKLDHANLSADLMPPYPMLEVDQINIPDFAAMCDRYDITDTADDESPSTLTKRHSCRVRGSRRLNDHRRIEPRCGRRASASCVAHPMAQL